MRRQQAQGGSGVARTPERSDIGQRLLFGRDEDQAAEKRVDDARGRIKSTLPAVGHAARRGVSKGVMMAGTHAGSRGARARLCAGAGGNPPRAGCEQSGNCQDGQQSACDMHDFRLEPQKPIITQL